MADEEESALRKLVGEELAGYALIEVLGEGGMAVVFRGENALDRRIQRAIKIVRPELSSQKGFTQRFADEARLLETLSHPNVVRFHGLRKERGFLVMELELLAGTTLADRLRAAPSGLPLGDALGLLEQATAGVAAAHALGIVHRDLKPENLYVTVSGVVKVLDFGIARALEDVGRATKLTAAGMTLGTPAYMAPEVCNGATPSERADVYALGMTLYEALAGHHPFLPPGAPPKSLTQMMFAHVSAQVPPVEAARPGVPLSLSAVVARALAKEPEARFPDANALHKALVEARGASNGTAPAASASANVQTQFEIPALGANPEPPALTTTSPAPVIRGDVQTHFEVAALSLAPATPRETKVSVAPLERLPRKKTPLYVVGGLAALVLVGFGVSRAGRLGLSELPNVVADGGGVLAAVEPLPGLDAGGGGGDPADGGSDSGADSGIEAASVADRLDVGAVPVATSKVKTAPTKMTPTFQAAAPTTDEQTIQRLEPRVAAHKATREEAQMLKALCKASGNSACVARAQDYLDNLFPAPPTTATAPPPPTPPTGTTKRTSGYKPAPDGF